MPKYTYKCDICDETFDVVHGMNEKWEKCELCNTTGKLEKVPSLFLVAKPNDGAAKRIRKFIDDSKADLLAQRKEKKEETK